MIEIVSVFSGVGGLDLGFSKAGFNIIYSNDINKDVKESYNTNFKTKIDIKSVYDMNFNNYHGVSGIIGGPPCQDFSVNGSMRGVEGKNGKLVWEYLRVVGEIKPKFFIFENVPGLLTETHYDSFLKLIKEFLRIGYRTNYRVLNANDYNVPQERYRVIIIGTRIDRKPFMFPLKHSYKPVLMDAISDIYKEFPDYDIHYSTRYMSRNRTRNWNEPSFVIMGSLGWLPQHPNFPMVPNGENWKFIYPNHRRLTVEECKRIQTFPDDFKFIGSDEKKIRMIGNAVPPNLAYSLAISIKNQMKNIYYGWEMDTSYYEVDE